MSKPIVMFTRPAYWAKCKSDKLDLVHIPLAINEPVMLRNKKLCGDSVGGVVTGGGLKSMVERFNRIKPQVFLFWASYMQDGSCDRLKRWTKALQGMKKSSPKTIFLYGNGNQQGMPDFNVQSFAGVIDGILVNTRDKREYRMYKEHGLKFVGTLHTFGFDPERHGPKLFKKPPKYDCFFGGSQTCDIKKGKTVKFYPPNKMLGGKYPNSKERLDFLTAVHKRHRLLIRGKGKWPMGAQPYLSGDEYPKAFGEARIALNMYHWDLVRYYTKRTVYAGASGRLLVCKYIPEMERDFTNGENLVWFKTVSEGLDLIGHYLKDDKERERIAAAQREHFIRHHSWEARLKEFEGIVGKVLG